MKVELIIVVNGKEEKIRLVHNPSERKTKRERFSFPDFAGKIATSYKGGKYLYINSDMLNIEKKDPEQISRKNTAKSTAKKTETKQIPEIVQENEITAQVSAVETLRILYATGQIQKKTYENRLKVLNEL